MLRVAVAVAAAAAAATWPAGSSARLGACPQAVRPLPSAPSAADLREARRAALRFARAYAARADLITDRMGVSELWWARDWAPAQFVRSSCGTAVWTATVAVDVVFPVMYAEPRRAPRGCAYCAAVVVLVARGERGWFAWDAL